jgi:HEPN domain-containing protein
LLDAESSALIVGFHCQQAVEKALKAVLAERGADFPYTHDVDSSSNSARTPPQPRQRSFATSIV